MIRSVGTPSPEIDPSSSSDKTLCIVIIDGGLERNTPLPDSLRWIIYPKRSSFSKRGLNHHAIVPSVS
jgi:hypothetical protein